MVVLDKQCLAQIEAVVGATTTADGVLLEVTQAGRGLASVEERRAGSFKLNDATCRKRCDAAETTQQIEGGPLARQDGPDRPGDAGNFLGNGGHMVAVGDACGHHNARTEG